MDETSSFGDGSDWCWWPETIKPPPRRRQALAGSEGELASLGRALPLAAGIVVEDQRLVGGHDDPEAAVDFRLELPGRPARVSCGKQHAARTRATRQRVEHRRIARDRDPGPDRLAVDGRPLPGVAHETGSGFAGPA